MTYIRKIVSLIKLYKNNLTKSTYNMLAQRWFNAWKKIIMASYTGPLGLANNSQDAGWFAFVI